MHTVDGTTFNVRGSNVSMNVPSFDANGSYLNFSVAYKLGRNLENRHLYFKKNTGECLYTGLAMRPNSWNGERFIGAKTGASGNITMIDLEALKNSTNIFDDYKGDYYFVVGYSTSAANDGFAIDFDLVEIPNKTGINPYDERYVLKSDYNPDMFVKDEDYNPDAFVPVTEKYITCWGDSLTAGGRWTTRLSELSGMTLYNAGTGGEGSDTITARQGGDVMMVNNITIPADKTPVVVATYADGGFTTAAGAKVKPSTRGATSSAHENPVMIANVLGTLEWSVTNEATSEEKAASVWTFTRLEAGDEVVIDRPTAMTTAYDREKNAPHLMVIFMGTNDGNPPNVENIIKRARKMIAHAKAENTIVLGITRGNNDTLAAYDTAMENVFYQPEKVPFRVWSC